MNKEQLQEMLAQEEETLRQFQQQVVQQLAFQQGRIKMIAELLSKEESNGSDTGSVVGSTAEVSGGK